MFMVGQKKNYSFFFLKICNNSHRHIHTHVITRYHVWYKGNAKCQFILGEKNLKILTFKWKRAIWQLSNNLYVSLRKTTTKNFFFMYKLNSAVTAALKSKAKVKPKKKRKKKFKQETNQMFTI